MRLHLFALFPLFFCAFSGALAAEPELGLELLPTGRPFRLAFADPREIGMGLSFEGDSQMVAEIGNYVSFFAIRPSDDRWVFHFGLEGGAFFTLRRAESRFPLETVDGLFGFYGEGSSGSWQGQLRYTHISAHLADGSTDTSIPYSREFVSLKGAYVPDEDLQIYSGMEFLVNSIPSLPGLTVLAGGSYFLPLASRLTPFVATDIEYKQESAYNPSLSLQLGIALNRPPNAYRSFRFFYAYYTGADPRGQYYQREFTSHSLGLEWQI